MVGYGAERFFTVTSFYEYGHYRGDSVAEIASVRFLPPWQEADAALAKGTR